MDATKDATCLITTASTSAAEKEKAKRVGHHTALQAVTLAQRAKCLTSAVDAHQREIPGPGG